MILVKAQPMSDGRTALITSRYDERFKDIAKSLPGMSWDKQKRAWVGYGDCVNHIIRRLSVEGVAKVQAQPYPSVVFSSVQEPKAGPPLREYQKTGVEFLLQHAHEGVLLADGTGIGKTKQALCTISSLGDPTVIVCPSGVKNVWAREAAKVGLGVTILEGVKPPPNTKICREDGIIVINYDIVYAWLQILRGAKTVVFDEAHALTNSKSRRSQVCKELAHSAHNRIALTATPMPNRTKELWNLVDTISPGRFGSFFQFAMRYTNAQQVAIKMKSGEEKMVWDFDGSSHVEELNERLCHFMLKRTKADVNLELPPKTRQIIEVDVPSNAIASDGWNLSDTRAVRKALGLSAAFKINYAVDLAAGYLKEGSNVVCFVHKRDNAHSLKEAFAQVGVDAFIATGENSANRRDDTVEKAKNASPSVLVVTTHSMGEGIDLSYADIGIVVELDYVPAKSTQLEGRLDRPGQTKNVLFQYLIGLGTIDELIRDAVITKLDVIDRIIGSTGDGFKQDLSGAQSEEDAIASLRDQLLAMGEKYYGDVA